MEGIVITVEEMINSYHVREDIARNILGRADTTSSRNYLRTRNKLFDRGLFTYEMENAVNCLDAMFGK